MADIVTVQELQDASLDVQTLETFISGDENTDVTSRLNRTYPTLAKVVRLVSENGLLGATAFKTYGEMSATSPDSGAYAVVTNDDTLDLNGIYQFNNDVWEYQKYNSIAELHKFLADFDIDYNNVVHDGEGNTYGFAIVNQDKKAIAWGMGYDKFVMPNHTLDLSNGGGFADAKGRKAIDISDDGKVTIYDLAGRDDDKKASERLGLKVNWLKKDLNHIILYGQSLSDGSSSSNGEPLSGMELSKSQPFKNLMLASGTRSEPQMTDLYKSNYFAPLVEQSIGQFSDSGNIATYNPSQNESPISAICNEFTRRCLSTSQKATADDFVMVGMSSGRGGQSVENLTDGTQWNVLNAHIKDIATTAKTLGKTQAVGAICYVQGEANHHAILRDVGSFDSTITADTYEYQNRMNTLIKKIDDTAFSFCPNQDFLPFVFLYQTEAHRSYNYTNTSQSLNENPISTAQWFITKSNPRYVLAVPVYALPKNDRDRVHLTHVGAWLLGAYFARAMHYTMHKKQGKWRPLEPVHYNWTDTHCDIEFYVPCGEIVLDDFFCAIQPNFGFDIWLDKVLQTNAIKAVSVLDKKTVRVEFNTPQPANAQLSYCLGREETKPNAWGNLRDTHGENDSVTDPTGESHKLHNPAVMFNIHKTRGFI